MSTVIYSANPLQAFLPTFEVIGFFFVIAGFGLGSAFFGRNQSRGGRIGLGAAGSVLAIAGCATLVFTIYLLMGGQKTATVLLNKKAVVEDNCNNGRTCTRLVLEMQAGEKFYDFAVQQNAFDKASVGGCYQVDYYPTTGIFTPSVQTDSYTATSNITRIKQMEASSCQ